MSSYIDYVNSIGDIINKRVVNLFSKKVVNKYTEKTQPKKEEEPFVLPSGTYIVIEYGSKHLGNPVRQTTIQIPNT